MKLGRQRLGTFANMFPLPLTKQERWKKIQSPVFVIISSARMGTGNKSYRNKKEQLSSKHLLHVYVLSFYTYTAVFRCV